MNESALAVVAGFALWVGSAALWAYLAHRHETAMRLKRATRLSKRLDTVSDGHVPGDL